MDLQFSVPNRIGVPSGSSVLDLRSNSDYSSSGSHIGHSQGPIPTNTASHTESPHAASLTSNAPIISLPPTNTHPMITRSKAGIFKPKVYAATKHPLPSDIGFVPNTYLQASKHAR